MKKRKAVKAYIMTDIGGYYFKDNDGRIAVFETLENSLVFQEKHFKICDVAVSPITITFGHRKRGGK